MSEGTNVDELLPLPANFDLSQGQRIRGLGGLPAHLRRLGRIEQLFGRARLIAARVLDGREPTESLDSLVTDLNVLLDAHNRYFPIEANLPIDPKTGAPLHGDEPFQPRPLTSRAELLRR